MKLKLLKINQLINAVEVVHNINLHKIASDAIDKATDRLLRKRKWKNGHLDFNIADNVFLKEEYDININIRIKPLGDYIGRTMYLINGVLGHDLANLK